MLSVTPFFAGILGLLYVFLSFYVIKGRASIKVGLGDGGDDGLKRRIRAHANFMEYVPIALILMVIDEVNSASKPLLILLGVVFVLGRISHAYSLLVKEISSTPTIKFRQAGMISTFGVIILLSLIAIF